MTHTPLFDATTGPVEILARIADDGVDIIYEQVQDAVALVLGNPVYDTGPDLLKALKVLADHAEERYPRFESPRGQREIAQAKAAIAKAKP